MNKILRYSFVALLAMVFGNVMATTIEVVIKDYAEANSWTSGTKYTSIEGVIQESIILVVMNGDCIKQNHQS